MNILLINHYAGSPEMGMEFRPYYLSREWIKMGHAVTIIAGDYSHLRKTNPVIKADFQEEMIDGIRFIWIRTGEYEGNGIRRAMTMFRFVRKLKKNADRIAADIRPDVVIASSTYPLDTYPAQMVAKKANARYIHEVHDMWPATLYEVGGMSKNNPFVMLLQKAEDAAYRHCDACVSLLPYAKEYMHRHGLDEKKFYSIPNGIVEEEWEHPLPLPQEHEMTIESLKQDGKFIVGYFGGHALSNCLGTLIDSADTITDQEVHFVLVGDGAQKQQLIEQVRERNIRNVSFLSPVDKRAVPTLVKHFDCIYIGAMDSPLYRFGVCMNKMYDSMMAGKAIVFAINAPDTPVTEYGCGIIVPPENTGQINEAILRLKAMSPEDRDEMGSRGKAGIVSRYTYQKLAKAFIQVMEEC